MKIILNRTRRPRERYTLIDEPMGGADETPNHVTNRFSVANGRDRGNGYQGYSSILYFLSKPWIPKSAKENCIKELNKLGYMNLNYK